MEEHLPPAEGDRGSSEPLVRHVTQAHPNDLVDPWWMDQALSRDYGEFIYRQWVVDIEDLEPEVVDRSLTEGVRLLRRGTLLNARRIQCVVEGDGALACIQLGRRLMWAGVAAHDLKRAQQLLEELGRSFPEATLAADDEQPHVILGVWGLQEESRSFRRLEVSPWSDIAANYAAPTRDALAPLMDPGFSLDGQGQLLVWFGPPGTGKSFALGALAYEWREHASLHYIADPEAFLGDVGYLLEFILARPPGDKAWRVAVLEDTGELFGAHARRQTGQGLARLLNATDGMLAQGSKTAFVITTNEPIERFHEAVIRPGRCASRVSFEPLPLEQARAWLEERDASRVAKRLRTPATLAELYAMAAGQLEPPGAPATGLYL
ncbi:MAG: AAA family ATPase [Actinomycetota bacterium]